MLPLGDGVADRHVMVDEDLLARICDYASVSVKDTVLEIGAGTGNLTEALLGRGCKVIAVEKDDRFYDYLAKAFPRQEKLTLISGDATKMKLPSFTKVVSNLPYSISKKITLHLLNQDFKFAVLVYQREFAEKLTAKPGTQNYKFISALAQSAADLEILEEVPSSAFQPQPNVWSAVVKLTPKKKLGEDYISFLRDLFNHKNKKIRNILSKAPDEFADARPCELSPGELYRLHSLI